MKQRETYPTHGRAKTVAQISSYMRRSLAGTVWTPQKAADFIAAKAEIAKARRANGSGGVVDVIYDADGNIFCKDRERCASEFELAEARNPWRTVGAYRAGMPAEDIAKDIQWIAQTEFSSRAAA